MDLFEDELIEVSAPYGKSYSIPIRNLHDKVLEKVIEDPFFLVQEKK